MKKIFMLAVLLTACGASASLKLTTQLNAYDLAKNTEPMYALTYGKQLANGLLHPHFTLWAGRGVEPFDSTPDVVWWSSKAEINFSYKALTVSPGVHVKYVEPQDVWRDYAYIKAEWKILD